MATTNQTKITAESDKQELFIFREFDAPRELVFRTFVEPKLLAQWLGPRRLTTKFVKFEPWTGGSYHYTQAELNGNEYTFHGVFHEIEAAEKIVQTFEFRFMEHKGSVSLDTALFEELPIKRTKLTIQSVFQSVKKRNEMLQSNMEKGVNEGHSRLDELLASL
ncbi:MAG: SRPBCC family protein [Bacteroidota bacterium]